MGGGGGGGVMELLLCFWGTLPFWSLGSSALHLTVQAFSIIAEAAITLSMILKGIAQTKMKTLSLITHTHVIPNQTRKTFAQMYSCIFNKLQLNHWCHMDYFIDVLSHFALLFMQGQKALGFHQKYLNLCSKDEWRSYGFGTTRGWVINDISFILGWTIPLKFLMIWPT